MKVVLVADHVDRDLGLLADLFQDRGFTPQYLERGAMTADPVEAELVVLLGSNRSAHDPVHAAVVDSETSFIRATLSQGTPIIGICYGAQVLARALGGSSRRGYVPECGWTWVDSSNELLCPPGLWGQMHHDIIVPAATSEIIGWSSAGPQAFIDESGNARAIGWQFHPELTLATFRRWLARNYSGSERSDAAAVLAHASQHAPATVPRAAALFRATLQYLGVEPADENSRPPTEAICVLGYN